LLFFNDPKEKPQKTSSKKLPFDNRGCEKSFLVFTGCFLKWWYPQNTPKLSFLVGKPMVVGYHHFRKPPYHDEIL